MEIFFCIVLSVLMTTPALAQVPAISPAQTANKSSKAVVTFPDVKESEIAIQTGANSFEVLGFLMEKNYAYARTCETEIKKQPCKAEELKKLLSKSQKEISDSCATLGGESRIARRFAMKKISSVCYFKEDKSFVEIH